MKTNILILAGIILGLGWHFSSQFASFGKLVSQIAITTLGQWWRTTLCMYLMSPNPTLKTVQMASFMLCLFYRNKTQFDLYKRGRGTVVGPTLCECCGVHSKEHGVRFHSLSTWIWSPGSVKHSSHFYPGLREAADWPRHRASSSLPLSALSPLPHENGLSLYRVSQVLQITTKSSCEALPLRICTDQNLKCLLASGLP